MDVHERGRGRGTAVVVGLVLGVERDGGGTVEAGTGTSSPPLTTVVSVVVVSGVVIVGELLLAWSALTTPGPGETCNDLVVAGCEVAFHAIIAGACDPDEFFGQWPSYCLVEHEHTL